MEIEWYWLVIAVLAVAWVGTLILLVMLVNALDDLRIKYAKLRIDLYHK